MAVPSTIYLGEYSPIKAVDVDDFAINFTNDLATGESVSSCTVALTLAGVAQAGAVTSITTSSPTVTFRVTAPSTAGYYLLTAVATMSDSRTITHTASLRII